MSSKSFFSFVYFPALKAEEAVKPTQVSAPDRADTVMDEEHAWYLANEHLGAEVEIDHPLVMAMDALKTSWSSLHLRVLAAMMKVPLPRVL
jgi:hypothetical protein